MMSRPAFFMEFFSLNAEFGFRREQPIHAYRNMYSGRYRPDSLRVRRLEVALQ